MINHYFKKGLIFALLTASSVTASNIKEEHQEIPENPMLLQRITKNDATFRTIRAFANYKINMTRIPHNIGDMGYLTSISITGYNLGGQIPPTIGKLTNLETLVLCNNDLSGEIPAEIGQLTQLKTLDLSHNQLNGRTPAEIECLVNLETLKLNDNELTEFHYSFQGTEKLKFLSLAKNHFTESDVSPELLTKYFKGVLPEQKILPISRTKSARFVVR